MTDNITHLKVKALKPMRYRTQFVSIGDIGDVIPYHENPLAFYGLIYDYWVSFNGGDAFGVFKEEVEVIKEESDVKSKSS